MRKLSSKTAVGQRRIAIREVAFPGGLLGQGYVVEFPNVILQVGCLRAVERGVL